MNSLHEFFAQAKQIHLTEGERQRANERISSFVKEHPVRGSSRMRHRERMTPPIPKVFGPAKRMRLDPRERHSVRAYVMQFVGEHPLRHRSIFEGVIGVFTSPFQTFRLQPAVSICTIGALFITSGSGVLAAAEIALPGDALYDVKVGITEELIGAILPEGEMQAAWNIEQVERRLEEAELLVLEGEFTEQAQEDITESLEEHIIHTTDEAVDLLLNNDSAGLDIELSLQASLDVHERFLSSLERSRPHSRRHLKTLVVAVRAAQKEVIALREAARREIAPRLTQEVVEEEVAESLEYAASVQEDLSERILERAVLEEIEGELATVETTLDQARQALDQGDTEAAFLLAQDAQHLAEEVEAAMEIVEDVLEEF